MGWQVNCRRGLYKLANPLKGLPGCLSIEPYTIDLLIEHEALSIGSVTGNEIGGIRILYDH